MVNTGNRESENLKGEPKMNLIIYLIAGAVVGCIASRFVRTNSQQGLLEDIIVGVVGAPGWVLSQSPVRSRHHQ